MSGPEHHLQRKQIKRNMPAYTPGLTWPRSDVTQDSWPTEDDQRPSNTHSWWEKLPLTHEKYKLYEKKTAVFLAEKRGIKGGLGGAGNRTELIAAAHYRVPMPGNYALFSHHKPDSAGKGERQDVYLRVSRGTELRHTDAQGCNSIGKVTKATWASRENHG